MQSDKKKNNFRKVLSLILLMAVAFPAQPVQASEEESGPFWDRFSQPEINGFCELRGGLRTQKDPNEKDISVMETRVQAEVFTYSDLADFKYKGDFWGDLVTEEGRYDTREAWIFSRPTGFLDIKIGRQILTWGTGDLVFLNDLFPKDWQSFFIGRDAEYLKAPSDAAKFSFFTDLVNMDVVYTPQFDADRHITGEYVSYWNMKEQRHAGKDAVLASHKPDRWFNDDEIALRFYKNISNYELAMYGYKGFWKRPAGESSSGVSIFPRLNVYGVSARGQVGSGIGNLEFAWYHSADDESGSNQMVDNSEIRYLAGYTCDMGKDLNAALQYYVEQLLNYNNYKENLSGSSARDRVRHVITLQLTKLMMNQNLKLVLSGYYSPTDEDAYIRNNIHYKYSDKIALEAGSNIFFGNDSSTFFAQFRDNTNIYLAVRYNFSY